MMKECHNLEITEADLCTAIAYWLNRTVYREPVEVTSIRPEKATQYGSLDRYTLSITPAAPVAKTEAEPEAHAS